MKIKTSVNVLLVDDERANLLALGAILENLDVNLIYASSGEEALRQALLNDFAVILLDFFLPTMGGLEVAQIIRTRSQTPIVFITASGPKDFPIEEAYSLGAVDYFTKPYNPIVLRSKVEFFIELHKRTEALAASERARYLSELNVKEGRIRLILENARGYAFIVTDAEGIITEWEGDAAAVTGWSQAEAIGQSIAIIFSNKDRLAGYPEMEMEIARTTGVAQDKRWHVRKNGSRFYGDGVMVPLKDAAGHIHGFSKIFRDSTNEQLAAREVQLAHDQMAEIFKQAPAFMCVLRGPQHIVEIANDRYMELVGHRDILNRSIRESLPELTGQGFFELLDEVYTSGQSYVGKDVQISLQRQIDGPIENRFIDFVYLASKNADGDVTGVLVHGVDQTERKLAETEREKTAENLRKLAADLSEADRRKSEFLATLAHELRNPLAPIKNGLGILRVGANNTALMEKTREMMERQVNHMVHLVDDLLDISRISGGKIELKKESVLLKELIASAVETSLPLIEAGQHKLLIEILDESVTLYVDPIRITQVVSNLLNNAAKYTPCGGQIEIIVTREGDNAILSVTDNGIGIPPDALSTIFEMFNQVPRNMEHAQGGLGIGLTLVRQIVEMHGGTVNAFSNGGLGSQFIVKLPIIKPLITSEKPRVVNQHKNSESLRIMVVDDNVDAAESLSMLLQFIGHTLYVANDGYDALKKAAAYKPHVAFVDIGMPGMNGYETASAIRKLHGLEGMVLVALTGWGAEEDRHKSREAGFDEHITKPAQLESIKELLSRVIPSLQ